jgi:hypothetical protein
MKNHFLLFILMAIVLFGVTYLSGYSIGKAAYYISH